MPPKLGRLSVKKIDFQHIELKLTNPMRIISFAAGFLHGYLQDKPLSLCAHYGAKVAAAVVQVMGAELPAVAWQGLRQEFES